MRVTAKRVALFAAAVLATYFLLALGLVVISGGAVSCQPKSCNDLQDFLADSQPLAPLVAAAISLTVGFAAARRI